MKHVLALHHLYYEFQRIPYISKVEPVGSRRTCCPAPTNTDDDYIILVDGILAKRKLHNFLKELGFHNESGRNNCYRMVDQLKWWISPFRSYRRFDDNINLIVTSDKEFFDKFIDATIVAKMQNLQLKQERVALFQSMLYGNNADK